MRHQWIWLHLLVASLALGACGEGTQKDTQGESKISGMKLYMLPHADGNSFACASCHAISEPQASGIKTPGHPIGDAFFRTSFKNGQMDSFLDAVNSCRTEWMNAKAFDDGDERWTALSDYLKSTSDGEAVENLAFEIVESPSDVSHGDAVRGAKTFNVTCAICHGKSAMGSIRGPALAGTTLSGEAIAKRIRTSGTTESATYDGLTGGKMPFWSKNRLTDDQLRDIVAFLVDSEPASDIGDHHDEVDLSLDNAQENCTATHSLVGKSLTFSTIAHGVAGTATVIDDCTVEFSDFSFDGGGIDVRVYGGKNEDYLNGITLSKNMLGQSFDGAEAVLRLPKNVSLDDFDGLSIWCVPVGFSFGDGSFR